MEIIVNIIGAFCMLSNPEISEAKKLNCIDRMTNCAIKSEDLPDKNALEKCEAEHKNNRFKEYESR